MSTRAVYCDRNSLSPSPVTMGANHHPQRWPACLGVRLAARSLPGFQAVGRANAPRRIPRSRIRPQSADFRLNSTLCPSAPCARFKLRFRWARTPPLSSPLHAKGSRYASRLSSALRRDLTADLNVRRPPAVPDPPSRFRWLGVWRCRSCNQTWTTWTGLPRTGCENMHPAYSVHLSGKATHSTSAAVVQGEPVPTAAGTPPDGRKTLGIRRNSDADAGRPDTVW
jgi:hypothetical protein